MSFASPHFVVEIFIARQPIFDNEDGDFLPFVQFKTPYF
jgi:hypothetical protein